MAQNRNIFGIKIFRNCINIVSGTARSKQKTRSVVNISTGSLKPDDSNSIPFACLSKMAAPNDLGLKKPKDQNNKPAQHERLQKIKSEVQNFKGEMRGIHKSRLKQLVLLFLQGLGKPFFKQG